MSERIGSRKKWTAARKFWLSLVIMIALSIINWGLTTGWGNVKITHINVVGPDGYDYSALMYTPKTATADNPAPGILMYHGGAGNARNHESWAVEFSRRGFVVISVDWNGSGDTESTSSQRETYEVPLYFADYITSLDIVDQDNILTSGHSFGSGPAIIAAAEHNFKGAMAASPSTATVSETAFSGNQLCSLGDADVDTIESGVENFSINARAIGIIGEDEEIEWGKLYGSFENNNAHEYLLIPGQVHEGAFVYAPTITALLDFGMNCVDSVPNYIDADSHIWITKDFCGLFGMFAFVITCILFALFLIDYIPFFSIIKQPLPRYAGLGKVGMTIAVLLALFFPVLLMKTGNFGLAEKMNKQNIALFSMGHPNRSAFLIFFSAILGAVMFTLYWFTDAKRHKATFADLGLAKSGDTKMDWVLVGKAFLLSFLVVYAGWHYLDLQNTILGTDFYCQFFGFRPIVWNKFIYYLPYFVIWILAFIESAISMNVVRRLPDTSNRTKDLIIAMAFNFVVGAAAVLAVVLIQNTYQLHMGGYVVRQVMGNWTIDITRLWGLPLGMAFGTMGSTYLYRKTGNIWVGAFLMAFICCLNAMIYGQHTITI